MSLWQRIWGAGARLFGPPPRDDGRGQAGDIDQASVVAALVALGAKMAKADGRVSRQEVAAFKRVFRASPENEDSIGRFFDLSRQTTLGFERYAKIIAKHFRARPSALEDILDGLFHIALADHVITDEEANYLWRVAEIFGLSEREFLRLKNAHLGLASDDPYLILGVDKDISDEDLKRAYRRSAAANHPDMMVAKGVPPELMGLANHKMAMINRAYAEIRELRRKSPK